MDKKPCNSQQEEVRKGPWTVEEDLILINYIANHGEGVWNSLAKAAGLKRTGKSCRLRWLNYLRPDVRRGNITPEEQLLIMELHAKWGNRWSKIAKHLPGRTDNEIKNFWRTRIQKHMKQASSETFPAGHQYSSSSSEVNNEINNEQATSSSQLSCVMAEQMGTFSASSSYHHHHYHHHHHEQGTATTTMADGYPVDPTPMAAAAESNDNYWNMEDLWSMQLFNGD